MKNKIIQKQLDFYILYKEFKKNPDRYVPAFEFVGEVYLEEFNRWEMLSYKAPARLSEMYQENPDLLDRKMLTGKSGSQYYGYKFKENVSRNNITDSALREFYDELKKATLSLTIKRTMETKQP